MMTDSRYAMIARMGNVNSSFRLAMSLRRKFPVLRFFPMLFTGPIEHSMEAYRQAYEKGYRTMLFDIRTTKDTQFVCWHDDDLSIVTRQGNTALRNRWLISNHFQSEVMELTLCKRPLVGGGKILTPQEILHFCYTNDCMAEVELKDYMDEETCQKFAEVVKTCGMDRRVILHRNQGEEDMLRNLGKLLPYAMLSRTANSRPAVEAMISLDVDNQKMVTITNYNGKWPITLTREYLELITSEEIGVIFSEVKKNRDIERLLPIREYLTFVHTRIIHDKFS